MQLIPFMIDKDTFHLFVILEDANIDRIYRYDPAHVMMKNLPAEWQDKRLGEIIIGYGTAADIKATRDLIAAGKPFEALQFLSRGFQYLPTQGDHDGPYDSMKRPS